MVFAWAAPLVVRSAVVKVVLTADYLAAQWAGTKVLQSAAAMAEPSAFCSAVLTVVQTAVEWAAATAV